MLVAIILVVGAALIRPIPVGRPLVYFLSNATSVFAIFSFSHTGHALAGALDTQSTRTELGEIQRNSRPAYDY